MKRVFLLLLPGMSVPGLGIIVAFHELTATASDTATVAIDAKNMGLLATSTNSFAAGTLMACVSMLLLVFLLNAALALTHR